VKDLFIAGKRIGPGETREINLTISEFHTATPANIPITVFRGVKDGPVLFVSAAIHGDELNGVGVIRKIIDEWDITAFNGSLVCLPIVNRFGFLHHSRYLPDRRDLNRCFPGDPSGPIASRISHILFHEVILKCTHGIDLHTASLRRSNIPHVRADMSNKEIRRMAKSFGTEIIIDHSGTQGSLRHSASISGVMTILFEAGETNRFQKKMIKKGFTGVYNVMAELGMIKRKKVAPEYQVVVKKTEWVRADKGGILDILKKPGEIVYKEEEVAVITNPYGKEVHTQRSPLTGLIVGITTVPLANPGSGICHVAKLNKTLPLVEKAMLSRRTQ